MFLAWIEYYTIKKKWLLLRADNSKYKKWELSYLYKTHLLDKMY